MNAHFDPLTPEEARAMGLAEAANLEGNRGPAEKAGQPTLAEIKSQTEADAAYDAVRARYGSLQDAWRKAVRERGAFEARASEHRQYDKRGDLIPLDARPLRGLKEAEKAALETLQKFELKELADASRAHGAAYRAVADACSGRRRKIERAADFADWKARQEAAGLSLEARTDPVDGHRTPSAEEDWFPAPLPDSSEVM